MLLQNVILFLIYIISLSYALQCTTNCSYTLNLTSPFVIPESCNQTVSAGRCKFQLTVWYNNNYSKVAFTAESSTYISNEHLHSMLQIADDSSVALSYSLDYECKDKDNCAKEFARNKASDILKRPKINYRAIHTELMPLLSSLPSTGNVDLQCFNSNENVRQCAIATKRGVCEASHQLIEKKATTRSCDNELKGSEKYVSMYDSGKYAVFSIKCNRSLCNGPMTMQAVKEIMFKYNVTKTMEGRLNSGLRRTLSSTFRMLIIVYLLLNQLQIL
jgi:hypothetical protein